MSYILSRWAWERKGRPDLLRETLPFCAVSVGAAIVLTLTTKYANQQALRMGLSHPARVLFADGAYLVANCVTFLTRFVIFHYVLFADRGSRPVVSGRWTAVGRGESVPGARERIRPARVGQRLGRMGRPGRRASDPLGGTTTRSRAGRPALTLPPPGARDHAGEVQPVDRVVPLLALADLAPVDRGGHLDHPEPVASTAMSSSDDWYCGCSSRTAPVTSARMARSPNEESVMR